MGHDGVTTPNTYCYFDYYQTTKDDAGYRWNTIEKVYSLDPTFDLNEEQKLPKLTYGQKYTTTTEHAAIHGITPYLRGPCPSTGR